MAECYIFHAQHILHHPVVGFTDFDTAMNHIIVTRSFRFSPRKIPSHWAKAVANVRESGYRTFCQQGVETNLWHWTAFWNAMNERCVRSCWLCGEEVRSRVEHFPAPDWHSTVSEEENLRPDLPFFLCDIHARLFRKEWRLRRDGAYKSEAEWDVMLVLSGRALTNYSDIYVRNKGLALSVLRQQKFEERRQALLAREAHHKSILRELQT